MIVCLNCFIAWLTGQQHETIVCLNSFTGTGRETNSNSVLWYPYVQEQTKIRSSLKLHGGIYPTVHWTLLFIYVAVLIFEQFYWTKIQYDKSRIGSFCYMIIVILNWENHFLVQLYLILCSLACGCVLWTACNSQILVKQTTKLSSI